MPLAWLILHGSSMTEPDAVTHLRHPLPTHDDMRETAAESLDVDTSVLDVTAKPARARSIARVPPISAAPLSSNDDEVFRVQA